MLSPKFSISLAPPCTSPPKFLLCKSLPVLPQLRCGPFLWQLLHGHLHLGTENYSPSMSLALLPDITHLNSSLAFFMFYVGVSSHVSEGDGGYCCVFVFLFPLVPVIPSPCLVPVSLIVIVTLFHVFYLCIVCSHHCLSWLALFLWFVLFFLIKDCCNQILAFSCLD